VAEFHPEISSTAHLQQAASPLHSGEKNLQRVATFSSYINVCALSSD
jgi:hypothetical protein